MSQLAQFSRYVGLVVLVSAAILLAPRATVAVWAGFTGWLRSVVGWRPGTTVRSVQRAVPVDVRVVVRLSHPHGEVIEGSLPRRPVREVWHLTREVLEAGAVLLALLGVVLRSLGNAVDLLPEQAVLAADLLLVLATFLVLQRVVRDYPVVPSLGLPMRRRNERVGVIRSAGRLDHAMSLVVMTAGGFVLLAWPSQLGLHLASLVYGDRPLPRLLIGWACELPWLVVVGHLLARREPRGIASVDVQHDVPATVPLPLRIRRHEPSSDQWAA
jgi:hypothetical protein